MKATIAEVYAMYQMQDRVARIQPDGRVSYRLRGSMSGVWYKGGNVADYETDDVGTWRRWDRDAIEA